MAQYAQQRWVCSQCGYIVSEGESHYHNGLWYLESPTFLFSNGTAEVQQYNQAEEKTMAYQSDVRDGDIREVDSKYAGLCGNYCDFGNIPGKKIRITSIDDSSGSLSYEILGPGGNFLGQCHGCFSIKHLKKTSMPSQSSSLKESFLIGLKSEPEKSFRKSGITNSDDLLTTEGQEVFLAWLLSKHGADFKKEVVDPILKEQEKESK